MDEKISRLVGSNPTVCTNFLTTKNSPAAITTELSGLPDDVIHLQNHQYEPDDTANVTSDIKKIFRLTLHLSTSNPLETRE